MDKAQKEKRLAELRQSVSEMTTEELYEHIGISRNNRRKPAAKPKSKSKKTSSKKGSSKKSKLDKEIGDLSPEQAEALLKALQNKS